MFRIKTFGLFSLLIAALAISACTPAKVPTATAPTSTSAPTIAPTPTSRPHLTLNQLKSGTYPLEFTANGQIQLVNGQATHDIMPDSASKLTVRLADQSAFGDLNDDGLDDAAIVLISNPGGSGTFYNLIAVLNQSGQPKGAVSLQLGDRVQLKSINIVGSQIKVDMITQGPSDPLCCPTLEVTQTYQLQGDQLIQVK
jgi:hypothetical protein